MFLAALQYGQKLLLTTTTLKDLINRSTSADIFSDFAKFSIELADFLDILDLVLTAGCSTLQTFNPFFVLLNYIPRAQDFYKNWFLNDP